MIEAVKHIETELTPRTDSRLKKKIGRGKLPVKWADAVKPADTPNVGELALSQLVLSTPGLAACPCDRCWYCDQPFLLLGRKKRTKLTQDLKLPRWNPTKLLNG